MATTGTWGKHKATDHNLSGILWRVGLLALAVLGQCPLVTTTGGVPHTVGNFFKSKGPQITLTMGSGEGAGLPLPPPSQESRVYTCLWFSMSTLWAQTAHLKPHSRYQKIKQSPGNTHYSGEAPYSKPQDSGHYPTQTPVRKGKCIRPKTLARIPF